MNKLLKHTTLAILLFLASQGLEGKSPHHKGLISSLNIGIRYSSVLQNRGVILYRDFQIDPVIGIFLLDDKIEFLGDSIGYRDFIADDKVRLRTKLVSVTDKPLFPSYETVKQGNPERTDTYEWVNQLEFFLPGYNDQYKAEFDISYAKDLSVHHGQYVELQSKIKLFNFKIPKVETLIEPNLYFSLGWGDEPHNKYFYGPSAQKAELTQFSSGLWFAFPEEADRFYPIIQIKHFQVIGSNRNGEFARDRNDGWLISFIATYGILPF